MPVKKILIVEDEETVLRLLSRKLAGEGFNVSEAKNGVEGLELAERIKPDLILLDLVLPKMDGITMLKELRRKDWGRKIKVLVLTNLSDDTTVEEALRHGTSRYLIKTDWKIGDVIKRVKEELYD